MLSSLLFTCLVLSVAFPSPADVIRVTTWNISTRNNTFPGTNEVTVIASALKQLNPDLLLLQGVRDWRMCAQIVQALKPDNYHVAVCSAFAPTQTDRNTVGEAAILTKQQAYFSWSDPWRVPGGDSMAGGFVFAALRFGKQRLGCFSAAVPASVPPDFSPQQLLEQIKVVHGWEANRIDSFLVGGTFNTPATQVESIKTRFLGPLAGQGFVEALSGNSSNAEILLIDSSVFTTNAWSSRPSSAGHLPVTCELEIDPVKAVAARATLARTMAPATMPSATPVAPAQNTGTPPSNAGSSTELEASKTMPQKSTSIMRFWWVLLLPLLAWMSFRFLRVRTVAAHNPPQLIPERLDPAAAPAAYTVVVSTTSVSGSAANPPPPQPVVQLETAATTHTESAAWQRRALAAEQSAQRAQEALRRGVLPHFRRWLKQSFAQKLLRDRSQLLVTQQSAARKALTLDQRLARIEAHVREQNLVYEQRIRELTAELEAAKEENRELIRARIAQIKAEMEAARAKLLAESEKEQEDEI